MTCIFHILTIFLLNAFFSTSPSWGRYTGWSFLLVVFAVSLSGSMFYDSSITRLMSLGLDTWHNVKCLHHKLYVGTEMEWLILSALCFYFDTDRAELPPYGHLSKVILGFWSKQDQAESCYSLITLTLFIHFLDDKLKSKAIKLLICVYSVRGSSLQNNLLNTVLNICINKRSSIFCGL